MQAYTTPLNRRKRDPDGGGLSPYWARVARVIKISKIARYFKLGAVKLS